MEYLLNNDIQSLLKILNLTEIQPKTCLICIEDYLNSKQSQLNCKHDQICNKCLSKYISNQINSTQFVQNVF